MRKQKKLLTQKRSDYSLELFFIWIPKCLDFVLREAPTIVVPARWIGVDSQAKA
jgi:hypothetical protein